jgi:hypothetical protein
MNRNRRKITWVDVLVLGGALYVVVFVIVPSLNNRNVLSRRASCRMNLGGLGKGIGLYQAGYKGEYPALANRVTLAQGPIDGEPGMVSITDLDDESAFLDGDVKGNGSVNAYYVLVVKGYVEEEGFKCPSDKTFSAGGKGTLDGRGYDLGFDGWKNLSYALQPTSIDAAAFSARPGSKSKDSLVIAADQVVDWDTPLTMTDNRPEENNEINHGYEYVNMLTLDGSTHIRTRQKGADSVVSKWGYDGDEIYTQTQSADPVERENDSRLMGKEGSN